MVVPDKLKVKNMILISIQCVLNVYSMCIQALAANTTHFRETKDYNNGGARSALSEKHDFDIYSMCTQCVFRLLQLINLISARQRTIIMVVPDHLKGKNMILISIQCVLNVHSMCIPALAANRSQNVYLMSMPHSTVGVASNFNRLKCRLSVDYKDSDHSV